MSIRVVTLLRVQNSGSFLTPIFDCGFELLIGLVSGPQQAGESLAHELDALGFKVLELGMAEDSGPIGRVLVRAR